MLRGWGRPDLADRLAYFASDEDLDDGDIPVTLESARGFLAFFGAVESTDGKVSLTCSPEGWILAVWRFPDTRRISLWFMDYDTVMYAARKSDGFFCRPQQWRRNGQSFVRNGKNGSRQGVVHLVQGHNGPYELPAAHHVARHCRRRDIAADGLIEEGAFRLRPGEEYLSTNWLEYFHDADRQSQIAGVRQALADKGFRVSRSASFAVLNVGVAAAQCRNTLNLDIQFIALGEAHDPSHTGIFGYTAQSATVAALLAASVDPNEVYPAAT